jgi:diguanylate cyclase (GGDEF)-like protein
VPLLVLRRYRYMRRATGRRSLICDPHHIALDLGVPIPGPHQLPDCNRAAKWGLFPDRNRLPMMPPISRPNPPRIDEAAMPAELRWRALMDGMERTRAGTAMHLPLFVLTGWLTGIAESQPAFFTLNALVMSLTLVMRMVFTRQGRRAARAADPGQVSRFTSVFCVLYLLPAAHWGVLAASSSYWPSLEHARVPIWLICTGMCAAGTIILSLLQTIRVAYPAAVLLPPMCVVLLTPSEGGLFAVAAAALLWIFVFQASKVIRRDYWSGSLATAELEQRAAELQRLSTTDSLTEICNRRHFDDCFSREWERSAQTGRSIAVMVIDIDHFKGINDEFGHQVGDRCIVAATEALQAGLRQQHDLVARYGGEEFAVLMPETSPDTAVAAAETLRQRVAGAVVEANGKRVTMTCSIGVCSMNATRNVEPDVALRSADRALYIAKRAGRNRVVSFDGERIDEVLEESLRKALYR